MDSGELCVIIYFDEMMPLLYAGSLDTTQYDYIITIIGQCEQNLHVLVFSYLLCFIFVVLELQTNLSGYPMHNVVQYSLVLGIAPLVPHHKHVHTHKMLLSNALMRVSTMH